MGEAIWFLSSLPWGERARERVKTVAFARLASYFFVLVHKKVTKEHDTPLPLKPKARQGDLKSKPVYHSSPESRMDISYQGR